MTTKSELPLTSTHWGTYRVETDDGVVTALHGFEEDDDVSPIGYRHSGCARCTVAE